LKNFASYFADR